MKFMTKYHKNKTGKKYFSFDPNKIHWATPSEYVSKYNNTKNKEDKRKKSQELFRIYVKKY